MASWETPEEAALREVSEEVALSLDVVAVDAIHHDDHGGWSYWTVKATVTEALHAKPRGRETAEMRWVPLDDVDSLDLHPGFAASWPVVRPC